MRWSPPTTGLSSQSCQPIFFALQCSAYLTADKHRRLLVAFSVIFNLCKIKESGVLLRAVW